MPLLLVIGTFALQLAWIVSVPPFGGIDEFDHAYRAAGVAHGQWRAQPTSATRGTGAELLVPRDIVDAARPQCEAFVYTTVVDCRPQAEADGGLVVVASGAGRYNPVLYAVIGSPTSFTDGYTALYLMRVVTALICAALAGLAGWAIQQWSRTGWPLFSMLVTMTPVLVYSGSIVAPNGVEMFAALALWCALLGLTRSEPAAVHRRLVFAAIPSAMLLVLVRSLGPLWLALIAVTVLAMITRRGTADLVRAQRGPVLLATGLVCASGLFSVWWTLTQQSLVLGKEAVPPGNPLVETAKAIPLWLFQSIAAFPTRTDRAPTLVYACMLVVGLLLVGSAVGVASTRTRFVLAVGLAFTIGVPFAIAAATYADFGNVWQGRYALPYSIGFILISGLALERRMFWHKLAPPAVLASMFAMYAAHLVSIEHVLAQAKVTSPLFGTQHWHAPSGELVLALVTLAWGLFGVALLASWSSRTTRVPGRTPQVVSVRSS